MKFYTDGFRGGNPDAKKAAPNRRERLEHATLPEKVDVLIVGTGPAGLCLAAQLAHFPKINTMIIESSPCNIVKGKADGINTRTMEMFQAFGFADKIKREAYWVNQTNFWMPDPDKSTHIKRTDRVQDVADDSSEILHILINQARMHQLFLEAMRNSPSRLEPDYNLALCDLKIDTDHQWARIMSAPPGESELDNGDEPRFVRAFKENLEFTGGLAVQYHQSPLIAAPTHQALATGQDIGRRFHSAPVVRLADAMQISLGHTAEADGRWRIYAFSGKNDSSAPDSEIHRLADWLERDPESPVVKHTREDEDIDAVIDVRAVFQQTFDQLAYEDMPSLLKPRTGKLGLQDHEKIFCVDHKGAGDIYDMRGINRERGCMIVVRPDQYIANVLPLDAYAELTEFFAGFLT